MGIVTPGGKFVGQTLTTPEALKGFFDLRLSDRDHWRDRLWERVDVGELSEDEALDLIIQGTDDNLVTAVEEPLGKVRWPVLRIKNGELVSEKFGPLSLYTDLSKPDGQLASKQARAIVRYFEQRKTPSQIFYAFSDQACGCFGVTMNYKPDTGEIMAVSKYYPMGIEELRKVFERLNNGGREIIMVGGEEADGPLGWQIRIEKEQDFISLEEQEWVIEAVMGDSVTEMIMPEFKNSSVWLGWGMGIGMGDVHLGSGYGGVSVTEVPKYGAPVVFSEPHPRGGVVALVTKEVSEEHKELKSVKAVPSVVAPVLIANESQTRSVSDYRIEKEITDVTEIIESTHLRVSGFAQSASAADLRAERFGGQAEILVQPHRGEPVVVFSEPHPRGGVVALVTKEVSEEHKELKSVKADDWIEEVITERTELTESTGEITVTEWPEDEEVVVDQVNLVNQVGQVEQGPVVNEVERQKVVYAVDQMMNEAVGVEELESEAGESVISIKSVKAKIVWLQRQIANVVADQLIGKVSGTDLGWLVHGWAMMQFDGIEEKQKMKRFSLSPVRIWADRVTGVVRRVKDKFVRTGFSVYKHLFAAI